MSTRPAVHLAIPVDDLGRAREFYGSVLVLSEGRAVDHWVDRNLSGHQLVTHVVPGRVRPAGTAFLVEPYLRFPGQPARAVQSCPA